MATIRKVSDGLTTIFTELGNKTDPPSILLLNYSVISTHTHTHTLKTLYIVLPNWPARRHKRLNTACPDHV